MDSQKKSPAMISRPLTRSGSRNGQDFTLPARPMTQQSQRLHTPGYEEMLNRRAKFERIVTPAQQDTRMDSFKNGSPALKSPSKLDVIKSLRQTSDVLRPSTSSGLSQHSFPSNSFQPQSLPDKEIQKQTEYVALDDIAERVVKLLKERNYSTDKKTLDFLGTL
jgi:hypothetical protein